MTEVKVGAAARADIGERVREVDAHSHCDRIAEGLSVEVEAKPADGRMRQPVLATFCRKSLFQRALSMGGEVIGIIPSALNEKEIAHPGLTEQHVVGSMHERKAMMAEFSDGFVAMPGGWGTFEEIFEVLTWAQLGFHEKPCGLLNESGYYDHLAAFLEHAIDQEFVKPQYRSMLMVEADPGTLLDRFETYQPPKVRKWISKSET